MSYPLQDHIHMATVLTSAPEYGPLWTWKATDRLKNPTIFMSANRALSGKLRVNVLQQSGIPLLFTSFQYILTISDIPGGYTAQDRADILTAMYGKRVSFIDFFHPNNGDDHTPAIRNMVLTNIGPFKVFTTMLPRYYVDISLEDDNTV